MLLTATAPSMPSWPKQLNPDIEPDASWKASLRKQIEEGLRDMYDDANKSFQDKLNQAPVDPIERDSLVHEHTKTINDIRAIAQEQFINALERERQERMWAMDAQMAPEWNAALVREQQAILDNIHKDDPQCEKSASPTDHPATPAPAPAPATHTHTHPIPWSTTPLVDEPDTIDIPDHPPPSRTKRTLSRSSTDPDPIYRPPASSPPKPIPEFWKPPISPQDDAAAVRSHISRRGSAASIGSIGSTNFRSTIPSQIPEYPGETDGGGSQARRTVEDPIVPSLRTLDGLPRPPISVTNRQSSQNLRAESSRPTESMYPIMSQPIPPLRPAEHSRPYHPHPPISRQQSQVLHPEQSSRPTESMYSVTSQPISPLRPAEHSRPYHPHPPLSRQPSQTLRPEEPAYAPPPTHPRTPARSIVRKRPSQILVFDDDPSPGPTSSPLLESPVRRRSSAASRASSNFEDPVYQSGVRAPSRSPVESRKVSSHFDDPARGPSRSPVDARKLSSHFDDPARGPSQSSADSRYDLRSTFLPDDDLRSPMRSLRTRTSTLDSGRFDQVDRYVDRHSHLGDSDDEYEYEDVVEPKAVSTELQGRRRPDGWDEEAKRQEAARLREEAARLEEEVAADEKRRVEDEKRRVREEELSKKEEEAKRKEEDARKKEEGARRKEEEARRKEEEARRKEEDARRKEEDAKRKEEEAKRKEEEAKKKEEEARRKEQEARLKEAEAKRKEEAARQKEEETRKKELEIRKREEEVKRREDELNRREAEAKLKDKEKQDLQQQEEFRKREEEIRRRADERKRQDSIGSHSEGRDRAGSTTYPSASPTTPTTSWSGLNRSGSTSTDRSSTSSPGRSSSSNASWSSSTRPSSTSSSTQAPSAPRPPTTPTSAKSAGVQQPPSPAPMSESEWARRQAEQAKKQQEQFRLEQERLERERQARAGKIMSKEEVIQLFETHLRQWAQLHSHDALQWDSFPWPMLKRPSIPEELTTAAIGAYVLSPHYPGDAAKPSKDRIKEHIKRWHPDRFETKLLPKVREEEREKVKLGAGVVARCLNDLLTRSNVSAVFS